MFLREAYGPGTATGVFALLLYVSIIVSEGFVARTFGIYVLQIVDLEPASFWVPTLGVVLLVVAYAVNIAGNRAVQASQGVMATIKVGGLAFFAIAGLWFVSSTNFTSGSQETEPVISGGFLAGVALAMLAYQGYASITNSGGELVDPHRNTGRAIIIAIAISGIVYIALAVMVAGNLSRTEIIAAENFALAEAARPVFGDAGVWFTVALALVATASAVIASVFGASRMLAMLTRMKQVPHRHFRMPGTLRTHTMVYTVVFAMVLTILFDLRRIAVLATIYSLILDIAIHWGILRHLRTRIEVRASVVTIAIVLDIILLTAFLWVKGSEDPLILIVSAVGIVLIVAAELLFMWSHTDSEGKMDMDIDMDM